MITDAQFLIPFNPRRLGTFFGIGLFLASMFAGFSERESLPQVGQHIGVNVLLLVLFLMGFTALLLQKQGIARGLLGITLLSYVAGLLFYNSESPSRCFLIVLTGMGTLLFLFRLKANPLQHTLNPKRAARQLMFCSSIAVFLNWFYVFFYSYTYHPVAFFTILSGVMFVFWTIWLYWQLLSLASKRRLVIIAIIINTLTLPLYASTSLPLLARLTLSTLPLILTGLFLALPAREIRSRMGNAVEALFFHPEGAVIVFFLGIISVGSFFLAMPMSSGTQEGVSWIDAAFMAVSAACVTGLAVLDITKDFSFTGQLILLILVQIGGLGIMFLSSLALLFVGQKLSLRQEATLMSVFGAKLRGEVKFVLRRILAMTFAIEALGIFILTAHFAKQGGAFTEALWKGTFLAISAFCNAGFFLHTQNLMPFARDPLVLQVVSWLIILGGLSPGFIFAFPALWKKHQNISLQFRFIAVATMFLLAFGTVMLAGLEWNRTLAPFGFWDKLNNAWFHSVVSRTAGFNSIDIAQTSPASQVILILLMFIGGAPGSTAGGVKVTTFMVIVFTVWSTTLGRTHIQAFSRHLPSDTVFRSTAIFIMGGGICFTIFLSLLLTQPNIPPLMALFEVVSALGTVGLTAGATPLLDSIGKSLIMLCMFLGRIGPLSIAVFFAYNTQRRSWNLPDEDVAVG